MVDWNSIQYYEFNFSKIKTPDFTEAILLDIKNITSRTSRKRVTSSIRTQSRPTLATSR